MSQATNQSSKLLDASVWGSRLFYGTWQDGRSTFVVTEPATGETLGEVGASSPADIPTIVVAARNAQAEWQEWPAEKRAALFRRAAAILEGERDAVVAMIIRETGGVRGKAEVEIQGTIDELYHSAALLIQPEGHILPSADPSRLSLARRVPIGVVGVIAPWNFPMLLAMRFRRTRDEAARRAVATEYAQEVQRLIATGDWSPSHQYWF